MIPENIDDTILSNPYYKTLEARFDRAAKLYDAAYGPPTDNARGNALMGWLHQEFWAVLRGVFPAGGALIDIGCGTGNDMLAMAQAGYTVLGVDVSPLMIRQAQTKLVVHGFQRGMAFHRLPAGWVRKLEERGPFQGAYSSFGVLNTEPNLMGMARGLYDRLAPGAALVAMVMNNQCLFERLHRGKPGEKLDRAVRWQETRAGAGGVTAPGRYYTPDEFAGAFAPHFTVESVCAFPLWLPPVHLHDLYDANPGRFRRREGLDRRMRAWPFFRQRGDHFVIVLRKTSD